MIHLGTIINCPNYSYLLIYCNRYGDAGGVGVGSGAGVFLLAKLIVPFIIVAAVVLLDVHLLFHIITLKSACAFVSLLCPRYFSKFSVVRVLAFHLSSIPRASSMFERPY